MMILSWFRKKVRPEPEPMAVTPGEKYIMEVGNPFRPDPVVVVKAVSGNWVQYRFCDGGGDQHTKIGYFRNCYKQYAALCEEKK